MNFGEALVQVKLGKVVKRPSRQFRIYLINNKLCTNTGGDTRELPAEAYHESNLLANDWEVVSTMFSDLKVGEKFKTNSGNNYVKTDAPYGSPTVTNYYVNLQYGTQHFSNIDFEVEKI